MSWSAAISHRGARHALLAQAAVAGLAAIGAAWIQAGLPDGSFIPLPAIAWTAAAAGCACLVMLWRLKHFLVWEGKLSALDAEPLDPLALASASGPTAADRGWNKLVDQGRQWQTLAELEQTVASKLVNRRDGDLLGLLDAISYGVTAVDAVGVITYCNGVMAAICGSDSRDELVGKQFSQALRVDDSTAALMHSDAPQGTWEWTVAAGEGSRRLRGERRLLAAGERSAAGYVWTIRDVTQQRLAEAMRDQFLSTATHEFRTPLANIRAYAESLELGNEIDPEDRKRFYNVIQSESLRLSQLVDDLLDISRMQAGALALDRGEVDLERLVDEAAAKVRGQLRDKGIQLCTEFPPKFVKVMADKSKLTAALVNLLGNAAKYTPDGGKVTFRLDINSNHVQFSVSDTGIGIAPEELPRIFERFFRSGDERVREITGSGLGLALSLEIARLHGGDITVESALNKGSTFRLTIPVEA